MEKTLPMILQWDESFDIGSDTLTGVNDADYKPPFPLTAKLNKLTIKMDRPQLSPADIKKLEAAMRKRRKANDRLRQRKTRKTPQEGLPVLVAANWRTLNLTSAGKRCDGERLGSDWGCTRITPALVQSTFRSSAGGRKEGSKTSVGFSLILNV